MPELKASPVSPRVTIRAVKGGLILTSEQEREAQRVWQKAQRNGGGTLHDGQIFHLLSQSRDLIEGCFVPYRYFLAGLCRPLAVSGVLQWDGKALMGKRSEVVTQYPGHWELVPSGGIEPRALIGDTVDWSRQLLVELEEESGIASSLVDKVSPFLLVDDGQVADLCCEIILAEPFSLPAPSEEYSEFLWEGDGQSSPVLPLSQYLLDYLRNQ